jgi:hypothetical protein
VGVKAQEIVDHIDASWRRGQEAVELLRQKLPAELVETLAPLTNGGVQLHKLFGVMHDTCNAANLVVTLMVELRERKARAFYGDADWDAMKPEAKACFDFLCGNHTRNLPIDWFNRLYNKWVQDAIGEDMKTLKAAYGGTLRLECNGEAFLRSLCKLTHRGHGQYVKGDGDAFEDFLAAKFPGVTNKCVGRADFSKRQDWPLEYAYNIFPLIEVLIAYTVRTLVREANVLRDTCLLLMECLHFEVYVHVLAILWRQIFKELRDVTNSKGLELHPIELNYLYEYLYDLGTLLQSKDCFDVFKDDFRAWPHIYKNGGRSKLFYGRIERNLNEDLAKLRSYNTRDDSVKYMGLMEQVFAKFGEGIHGSLHFTMKKYLRQTNGALANDKREEWETKAATNILCHNNNAERPFATMRAYHNIYPAMTLQNLSWLSHSLVNGTHRPEHVFGRTSKKDLKNMIPPGIALTAHPILRQAAK